MSSLVRNVPFLTSIEMSLFLADTVGCPALTILPINDNYSLTLEAARSARRRAEGEARPRPWFTPGERGFVAVGKWETCFWFSTFPSACFRRSCGNVGISRSLRDFQGTVGRGEILPLDFHAFHRSAISTARFSLCYPPFRLDLSVAFSHGWLACGGVGSRRLCCLGLAAIGAAAAGRTAISSWHNRWPP